MSSFGTHVPGSVYMPSKPLTTQNPVLIITLILTFTHNPGPHVTEVDSHRSGEWGNAIRLSDVVDNLANVFA